MIQRNTITPGEAKLFRISQFISLFSRGSKKKKRVTLKELVDASGISADCLDAKVQSLLNSHISGVYRSGSRFFKGCVACQLYDDGDGVMEWAYQNGAAVLVTKHLIKDYPCIVVKDPALVYARMCSCFLDEIKAPVTAIVGSIGKTTTKMMLNSVYSTQYNSFTDLDNENLLDCVGYIFQHIPKKIQRIVQEISEDTPGYLSKIAQVARPSISVVTAIDKSHIEAFGSEQEIRNEIFSVQDGMSDGVIIMEMECASGFVPKDGIKLVTVSIDSHKADYYAKDVKVTNKGLNFTIVDKHNNRETPIALYSVYALHNIYLALFSYAAAIYSDVKIENIQKGLSNFRTVGIRQNIFKAKDNVTVYADCYNATATSVKSAIKASAIIPIQGKRIAVLGDIEECGEYSFSVHNSILDAVEDSNFDELYALGDELARAIAGYKFRNTLAVKSCKDRTELINALRKSVDANDLVLFKASRKSALEKVISALWPITYMIQHLRHRIPAIKWRIRTLMN